MKNKISQLHLMQPADFKSGKRGSNPRPSAWEADALPLSYSRDLFRPKCNIFSNSLSCFFKNYLMKYPGPRFPHTETANSVSIRYILFA